MKKAGLKHRRIEERFTHKPLGYDLWKAANLILDRFLPADTLLLYLDEKAPVMRNGTVVYVGAVLT